MEPTGTHRESSDSCFDKATLPLAIIALDFARWLKNIYRQIYTPHPNENTEYLERELSKLATIMLEMQTIYGLGEASGSQPVTSRNSRSSSTTINAFSTGEEKQGEKTPISGSIKVDVIHVAFAIKRKPNSFESQILATLLDMSVHSLRSAFMNLEKKEPSQNKPDSFMALYEQFEVMKRMRKYYNTAVRADTSELGQLIRELLFEYFDPSRGADRYRLGGVSLEKCLLDSNTDQLRLQLVHYSVKQRQNAIQSLIFMAEVMQADLVEGVNCELLNNDDQLQVIRIGLHRMFVQAFRLTQMGKHSRRHRCVLSEMQEFVLRTIMKMNASPSPTITAFLAAILDLNLKDAHYWFCKIRSEYQLGLRNK